MFSYTVFYAFSLKYPRLSNISQASNPTENDIATISEPPLKNFLSPGAIALFYKPSPHWAHEGFIEISSYQRHRYNCCQTRNQSF